MDDGLDLNDLPGEAARRGPRKVALSKPKKLQPRPEPVRQRPAQQFVDIADMYRYRGHHHHQNPQRNQRQNVSFDYWDILSKLILFTVVLAAGYVAVVAGIFVVSIVLHVCGQRSSLVLRFLFIVLGSPKIQPLSRRRISVKIYTIQRYHGPY